MSKSPPAAQSPHQHINSQINSSDHSSTRSGALPTFSEGQHEYHRIYKIHIYIYYLVIIIYIYI